MSDERIKRGVICIDDYKRLFIITVDEQKSMSWNGDFAGNAWAGTCLLDGKSTLCVNPKFVAASFKEYIATFAADVGIKAAHAEIDAMRNGRIEAS